MENKLTEEQLELRDAIRNRNLYLIVSSNSTNRVLKCRFYMVENNHLFCISKEYKSNALGMSRTFDCFLSFIKDNGLEMEYGTSEYKKENGVGQTYQEIW